MDGNQTGQNDSLDTTDCLEAVGVFRGWKNFLFVIVALCLLLSQLSFWLVNAGYIGIGEEAKSDKPAAVVENVQDVNEAARKVVAEANQPAEAARQEPKQPAEAAKQQQARSLFGVEFKHLCVFIESVNFVLILTAMLYCLTMLFSLKVSLIGRLGGINYISRAFFLSLVMLVLLLPWQSFFGWVVKGAIYTPNELVTWLRWRTSETRSIFGIALYYLRFTGYWLLVLLLLILSQLRSSRWTKAILRRLEVI